MRTGILVSPRVTAETVGAKNRGLVIVVISLMVMGHSILANRAYGVEGFTTTAPDLRSVTILDSDPFEGDSEIVEYCFDQPNVDPSPSLTAANFGLVGFNSSISLTASSATRAGQCVRAHFPSGLTITEYSLGVVSDGAVVGGDGRPNVQAALPLQGSELTSIRGDTTQPQLRDTIADPHSDRVTFLFDEVIDPTMTKPIVVVPGVDTSLVQASDPAPNRFIIYGSDGVPQFGTEVVAIGRTSVLVQFPAGKVKDAVRYAVSTDAVPDRQQANRTGQKNPQGAVGETTADPDLIAAKRLGVTNRIDFEFDESLQTVSVSSFFAYAKDGASFTASRAILRGGRTVRATFPVGGFADKIVYVAINAGAAKSTDNNKNNTIGSQDVANSAARPGGTDGPDLTAVAVDVADADISFYFDRPIDRRPTPSVFRMIDEDGRRAAGQELVAEGRRVVTIGFEGSGLDMEAAIGATINLGAVKDLQGKSSPIGTRMFQEPPAIGEISFEPPASVMFVEDSIGRIGRDQRLTVRVTDEAGVPVEGAEVEFSSSGIGTIKQAAEVTNGRGIARATLSSSDPGTQQVDVLVPDCAIPCVDTASAKWVKSSDQLDCDVVGTDGDDVLHVLEGRVTCTFGGDDVVYGRDAGDIIHAGAGDDLVEGRGGRDVLYGESGDDVLAGGNDRDILYGGSGRNQLKGGGGRDKCRNSVRWYSC